MDSHGVIAWIIIGGIAGWLAGLIVRGGGFGVIGDIVVGIVGAMLFGWLFGVSGLAVGSGLIGSIVAAVIGSVILILALRLVTRAV
jgi:uncharacterized membrane protein YeaQ/YmgE (transglycosylase-associated protein family)